MMVDMNDTSAVYEVVKGECGGIGLFRIADVAVQVAYMGRNTILKEHTHHGVEILVLFEGDMSIHFGNGAVEAYVGDPVTIQANTPHYAESNNGCKMIAITIPASEGYPNGK